jgi:hypothetical protein
MSIAKRVASLLAGVALLGTSCRAADVPDTAPSPPKTTAPRAEPTVPAAPRRTPTNADPVVVTATLEPPRIAPGGTSLLTIHVDVATAWHIYPRGAPSGANAPTALAIELPAGLEWDGDWRDPPPQRDPLTHSGFHSGAFDFTRNVKAGASLAAGAVELAGAISYQVCDPLMCRPPERQEWRATLVVATASAAQAASAATPRDAARTIELRVLYLGPVEEKSGRDPRQVARARDYDRFLRTVFSSVRCEERDHFDPKSAGDVDVALLDWSQSQVDLAQLAKLPSPLGARDEWKTPTVLLGSAGLLIGMPWQVKGSFG